MWSFFRGVAAVLFSSIFNGTTLKFGLLTIIFYFVTQYSDKLIKFLPEVDYIKNLMGGIPEGVWYFVNLFALDVGIGIIISSTITGFLIKRIIYA